MSYWQVHHHHIYLLITCHDRFTGHFKMQFFCRCMYIKLFMQFQFFMTWNCWLLYFLNPAMLHVLFLCVVTVSTVRADWTSAAYIMPFKTVLRSYTLVYIKEDIYISKCIQRRYLVDPLAFSSAPILPVFVFVSHPVNPD